MGGCGRYGGKRRGMGKLMGYTLPYNDEDGREAEEAINGHVSSRVVRGGSWYWIPESHFRTTTRDYSLPDDIKPYLGFRCVRSFQ